MNIHLSLDIRINIKHTLVKLLAVASIDIHTNLVQPGNQITNATGIWNCVTSQKRLLWECLQDSLCNSMINLDLKLLQNLLARGEGENAVARRVEFVIKLGEKGKAVNIVRVITSLAELLGDILKSG